MAFILGKKMGMTQIFNEDGTVVPVTIIEVEQNVIVDIRTNERDGYSAVQLGYQKAKRPKKPQVGHAKKIGATPNVLREFRTNEVGEMKIGDTLNASNFSVGETVKVSGIAKAKGFQGVVKRHGFKGAPASHGHHKVLRHAGSIGQRFPQHTLKGLRMAGRMGGKRATVRGLLVVSVDPEANTIAVRGAVPGRRGTLLELRTI